MIVLAIIGALVVWFCVGFTAEYALSCLLAAVVYGPIGLAFLTYEHFEGRRWRHR